MATLSFVGYILVLIGGILLSILGLIGVLGILFVPFSALFFLGEATYGLVTLIIGVVCIICSRLVSSPIWAIIFIILGLAAGGLGGILVVMGAILGLISRITRI